MNKPLIILAALVLAACNKGDKVAEAPVKPALTVKQTFPTTEEVPVLVSAMGVIAPWQESSIGSEVSGLKLSEVLVEVGDSVKKGQVLAKLNNEQTRLEQQQLRASLAEAQAAEMLANSNLERGKLLRKEEAVSVQDFAQLESSALAATAKVANIKAQLAISDLKVRNTTIVAPDSGVISSKTAVVGAMVNQGTELFKLIRQNKLEWRAEVSDKDLTGVAEGQSAVVTANQVKMEGVVRKVSPSLDTSVKTALVYVDLTEANVKANTYAQGIIQQGTRQGIVVPASLIQTSDGRHQVPSLVQQGNVWKVTWKKVILGQTLKDKVEVLEGISASTPLIQQGAGFLNEGDVVTVQQGDK